MLHDAQIHTSGRLTGLISTVVVTFMFGLCLLTMPYTFGRSSNPRGAGGTWGAVQLAAPRYEATNLEHSLLPPFWAPHAPDERERVEAAETATGRAPRYLFGSDKLGRSMFIRCLAGGGISLFIGLAAACIAVGIGTLYGTIAGAKGGRTDTILMRIADVLYGLPYILLVVLLAVAVDGLLDRLGGDVSPSLRQVINVVTLLVAIGSVSWLTMARVIRGQVMSLKAQPFMEACRTIGVPPRRQFTHHLLPNLLGPIIVYATLTVPAAILSESFLSFLGIGVREPLPSWGNLAAAGLNELNIVRARWWLLLWPCLFITITLMALNFMGEALREKYDPKRGAGT